MKCPYCSSPSRIVNSRKSKKTNATWRRHRCVSCGADFTTYEAIDYEKAYVVQRKSRFEPFRPSQLLISIYRAIDHRPYAERDAEALTKDICARLARKNGPQFSPSDISAAVISALQNFDAAGAVKYQANHQTITTYRDVQRALRKK